MSDLREMTLDEYLESKLPDHHLARRQLLELRDRLKLAKKERDQARWELRDMSSHARAYRADRDALEAHLERLQAKLEDRLEAAEREVSNRKGAYCVLEQGYKRISEERDALAAHVEFCHKVMSMVENGPEYLVARQYRALRMARERKPETSLGRLKAQWQVEAVVEFGYRYGPESEVRAASQSVANGFRRQAEVTR